MTDLLPIEPDELSLQADPVGYMTVVLHRAKGWLDEAQSIDNVREAKAIAMGYETVIREKEMAFDAQLSATEIVRRCERRIGQLVREGQEQGTIRRQGQSKVTNVQSSTLVFPAGKTNERADSYAMAAAPNESFDQAIDEAKAEGNLSRANVVRKVKGESKPDNGRSEWHHKKRHIDSNRIVEQLCLELQTAATGLDLVDPAGLDVLRKVEWIASIQQSIRTIQREVRRWA